MLEEYGCVLETVTYPNKFPICKTLGEYTFYFILFINKVLVLLVKCNVLAIFQ